MRTSVFKFKLPVQAGVHNIAVFEVKKLLCLQVQKNNPVFYAEIDPDKPCVMKVAVYQTGDEFGKDVRATQQYIGTAIMDNGTYVLHYYQFLK